MQDRIYKMITDEDDVSWQSMLYELVKTEQMDPWDVDISQLTKKYIAVIKGMKEANLKMSGKVLLASAILLKMKCKKLLGEDMLVLDNLFHASEEEADLELYEDELDNFDFNKLKAAGQLDPFKLIPRTPQPRKRKVSIYDLVGALEKAMEVRRRRIIRHMPDAELDLRLPERKVDISRLMKNIYVSIKDFFAANKTMTVMEFSQLIKKEDDKLEKVRTFIPLLHLENQRRVEMSQEKAFGPINISLLKKSRNTEEKE